MNINILNESIRLYIIENKSVKEISKITNCSEPAIYNTLRKNNVELRKTRNKNNRISLFNKDDIVKIIKDYTHGISISVICNNFNCDRRSIKKILLDNNVSLTNKYRTHIINENFFDVIDTEAKAYFLGLLFADGNNTMSNRQNRISINLQERDKYVLEQFRYLISPTSKLFFINKNKKNKNHQNAYLLSLSSKKLCIQLNNLGCIPNKSLILRYPNCIPNNLEHHFVRGYFDGDGCITQYTNKKSGKIHYKITIISTLSFCETIQKILKRELNIDSGLLISHNGITTTLYMAGHEKLNIFSSWLYNNATYFLERKIKKFQDNKNLIRRTHVNRNNKPEQSY